MNQQDIHNIFDRLRSSRPPRVLLVYAHPDDEAISVGGHLSLFRNALFLQATDGAPADNADGTRLGLSRDEYRVTRALELRAAFAAAGLPEARHRCLNLPDKEAAFHLAELTALVAHTLATEQPEVVFTHPYEGGHADHDACAFAVHTAIAALDPASRPTILESPFYFRNGDGTIRTGAFLHEDPDLPAVILPLSPGEKDRKRSAFDAFQTQQSILKDFEPALQHERFRVAPAYDFTQSACAPPAFYESFIPDMNPVRFAGLATAALQAWNRSAAADVPANLAA